MYSGTSVDPCPKYSSGAIDLLGTGAIVRHLTSGMIVFAALLCVVTVSFWYAVVDPSGLPENMRPFADNPGIKAIPGFALVAVLLLGVRATRHNKRSASMPKLVFFSKLKSILLTPTQFFSHMPVNEGIGDPMTFGVICALVYGLIYWLLLLAGGQEYASALLFVTVAVLVFSSFMNAAISYSVMRVFGSAPKGSFEAAARVALYSLGASTMLAWVPVLGMISAIYGPVLIYKGLKSVYSTSHGTALAAVLISYILTIVVIGLLVAMVAVLITTG